MTDLSIRLRLCRASWHSERGATPSSGILYLSSVCPSRASECLNRYIIRALSVLQVTPATQLHTEYFTEATPPYSNTSIMSSHLLTKFDPSVTYPFTDHTKSVIPEPPPPSKYARGVPPAHVTYMQNPPSLPPPTPLVAPIPQQYAPPQIVTTRSTSSASSTSSSSSHSSYKPIFTQIKLNGRPATPELEDVLLKKKSTWSKK